MISSLSPRNLVCKSMDKQCRKNSFLLASIVSKTLWINMLKSIVYGAIIAIVMCPCQIGYTAIIYSDPSFHSYLPYLVKLNFVSCVMHQLVFTMISPLPFAIGQVQDAGLIFLSTMATAVMTDLGHEIPLEERVATSVVFLSLSTFLLGLALVITGKLKLANVVQYLPMPVIGGYLAYIGLFTLQAGVSLMTDVHLKGITTWNKLWSLKVFILGAPGVLGGILLVYISGRFRHFTVLPCCLIAMPSLFFLILYIFGVSFQESQVYGWVTPPQENSPTNFYMIWSVFKFNKVHWVVMFSQIPTWIGMYLVISFSSSLDIAAVSMGTGQQLDYNKQLQTVGYSNMLSGATGGYTGSYIFSQTLFNFRSNCNSRLVGLSLAFFEFCIIILPISIVSVLPKFFFGSVMVFIGVDLLRTWLCHVYYQMLKREYFILLLSFISINILGPQRGMGVGIAFAAFNFLFEYSGLPVAEEVLKRSNVIRNMEQRDLLFPNHRQIMTIELHGHIFFGSSNRILKRVKRAVKIRPTRGTDTSYGEHNCKQNLLPAFREGLINLDGSNPAVNSVLTRYLVFDFKDVSGLDATAARSCFLSLRLMLREHNIQIVYSSLKPEIEYLLRANEVVGMTIKEEVFADLDLALDWCEQKLLIDLADEKKLKRGDSLFGQPTTTLIDVFKAYLHQDQLPPAMPSILQYFDMIDYQPNDVIFFPGQPANCLYFLVYGEITLCTLSKHINNKPKVDSDDETASSSLSYTSSNSCTCDMELLRRVSMGVLFGDLDFYMEQK